MNRLLTERQPATQIHQQGTKQRHTSATRWPPRLFHEIPLRRQLNSPSYPYRRLVLPRTPTERGCPPHSGLSSSQVRLFEDSSLSLPPGAFDVSEQFKTVPYFASAFL